MKFLQAHNHNRIEHYGKCPQPHKRINGTPRYKVNPGTKCYVKRVDESEWEHYTTSKESHFERWEKREKGPNGFYIFRKDYYHMLVPIRDVEHRWNGWKHEMKSGH